MAESQSQQELQEERASLADEVSKLELRLVGCAKHDLRRPALIAEKTRITARLSEIKKTLSKRAYTQRTHKRELTQGDLESPDGLIYSLQQALLAAYPPGPLPTAVEAVLAAAREYLHEVVDVLLEEEGELRAP